jgi:hypothetical protein
LDQSLDSHEISSDSYKESRKLHEYIETEVRGNTLHLGFKSSSRFKSFNPSDWITFDLILINLNRLDISGAGDIDIEQLKTDKLTINLSGAGSLEIKDLRADELVTQVSGAGSIIISGQVTGQEITHSGVGTFHPDDLRSDTAFIKISGAGSCTVWVLENLDVSVSGLGNVIYFGNPRVSQSVSGLGKVINQGAK